MSLKTARKSGAHIPSLVCRLQRSVSVRRRELHPMVLETIVMAKRLCLAMASKLCKKQLLLYSPTSQTKRRLVEDLQR